MEFDHIHEAVKQMVKTAEESYQSQAGGASICQLQKDGRVTGGVKYDEGRLVALHNVQRILRTRAASDWRGAIAAELIAWTADLAAQEVRAPLAITWLAYRQGGVDMLGLTLDLIGSS